MGIYLILLCCSMNVKAVLGSVWISLQHAITHISHTALLLVTNHSSHVPLLILGPVLSFPGYSVFRTLLELDGKWPDTVAALQSKTGEGGRGEWSRVCQTNVSINACIPAVFSVASTVLFYPRSSPPPPETQTHTQCNRKVEGKPVYHAHLRCKLDYSWHYCYIVEFRRFKILKHLQIAFCVRLYFLWKLWTGGNIAGSE